MGFPLFPEQSSTNAVQVDTLFFALVALASFFALLVAGLIIYFSLKYRRRLEDELPEQVTGSTRLEILWSVIPLILALGIFTWAAIIYINQAQPPADALEVYAVAKQWMWEFQHAEGQQEINELHVPVGRPVRVTLISQDVIHSLYIPAFRIKSDVLPGRYTTLWFEATQTGEYHLFCAEYCGTLHAGMIGRVFVMTPTDYAAWLGAGPGQSPSATGERLFQQFGCVACHRSDGQQRAPALEGVYGQPVELTTGETVTADDSYLRESILDPNAKVVAGYQPIMPSYQGRISEQQLLDILAYIRSIGPGGGATPAPPPPASPAPGGTPVVPGATPGVVPGATPGASTGGTPTGAP